MSKTMTIADFMSNKAETWNGRVAMLGFLVAIGTYVVTGEIIPGIF
ncbi:possible high light inducible protein [Prochlorococcus marinus str. MIT 9303]|nr:possible high light inducible protein [Prochlorococcus marinus str. MIT 9303]